MYGLKAVPFKSRIFYLPDYAEFMYGLNRLRKKGIFRQIRRKYPSAAKAAVDFEGLMYGLKPVPFA